MAKLVFDGIDEYMKKLAELGADIDKAARFAVYPAAGYVLDELKAATPVRTGALRDSETLTKFTTEADSVYTEIVFEGVDAQGSPNAVKARVLESGTSKRKKKPFIRPTLSRVSARATQMMSEKMDEYIKNHTGGK